VIAIARSEGKEIKDSCKWTRSATATPAP
jgi:hypothetical protein